MTWVAFAACAGVLLVAGTALARQADAIADASGIGRVWIGSVLLAGATSLPELATDIQAVRIGLPDLAAGDLFGSSLANMLILALLDLRPVGGRQVLRQVTLDHALAASLAILLTGLAAAFVLVGRPHVGLGVSLEATVLLFAYVLGTRAIYLHGAVTLPARAPPGARSSVVRPALSFAVAAAVVLLVAPVFASTAARLADETGLGATFVGTLLVGLSTSLPELVSSFAAARAGSFDLAVGNLFGSNAFNMAIFFALDAVSPGASIFAGLDPGHAVTAQFAVVLMCLGVATIVYRAERRSALLEPTSALIALVWLVSVALLYARAGRGGA